MEKEKHSPILQEIPLRKCSTLFKTETTWQKCLPLVFFRFWYWDFFFFWKRTTRRNKNDKNALIGLGLTAAIEKVGTEMNGGLSPFQGIYDALQDNPSGFRQQF